MRYTTIIDIGEFPELYGNRNIRLVYLHLVLRSGYHDDDRDLIAISSRHLAADVGVSHSACRHALQQLLKAGLLTRQGDRWAVKKWVLTAAITARPKTQKQQKDIDEAARRAQEQRAMERRRAQEKQAREDLLAQGKTPMIAYYEQLQRQAAAGDEHAKQLLIRHKDAYEKDLEYIKNLKQQKKP